MASHSKITSYRGRLDIPIIPLPRLRVIIHLHLPFRRRINESLPRLLPGAICPAHSGAVPSSLEEEAANNEKAIDGQVDDQHERDMQGEQDNGSDQAEQAIGDDDEAQHRFYLTISRDEYTRCWPCGRV